MVFLDTLLHYPVTTESVDVTYYMTNGLLVQALGQKNAMLLFCDEEVSRALTFLTLKIAATEHKQAKTGILSTKTTKCQHYA